MSLSVRPGCAVCMKGFCGSANEVAYVGGCKQHMLHPNCKSDQKECPGCRLGVIDCGVIGDLHISRPLPDKDGFVADHPADDYKDDPVFRLDQVRRQRNYDEKHQRNYDEKHQRQQHEHTILSWLKSWSELHPVCPTCCDFMTVCHFYECGDCNSQFRKCINGVTNVMDHCLMCFSLNITQTMKKSCRNCKCVC